MKSTWTASTSWPGSTLTEWTWRTYAATQESELSWTCEAQGGKAMRLSIGTGYDLLTYDGTQSALNELVT